MQRAAHSSEERCVGARRATGARSLRPEMVSNAQPEVHCTRPGRSDGTQRFCACKVNTGKLAALSSAGSDRLNKTQSPVSKLSD